MSTPTHSPPGPATPPPVHPPRPQPRAEQAAEKQHPRRGKSLERRSAHGGAALLGSSVVFALFLSGYLLYLVPTLGTVRGLRNDVSILQAEHEYLLAYQGRLSNLARTGDELAQRGSLAILKDIVRDAPADAATAQELFALIQAAGARVRTLVTLPSTGSVRTPPESTIEFRRMKVTVSGVNDGVLPTLLANLETSSRLFTIRSLSLNLVEGELTLEVESAVSP